jgi:hypothetical protein
LKKTTPQNSQKEIGSNRTISRAVTQLGMAIRIDTPILRVTQMRFGQEYELFRR